MQVRYSPLRSKTPTFFSPMNHLFQALTVRVDEWRKARYECPDFPAIGEILDFALEDPATD